ncbi:AAA family ATPase [Coriobacterium glomerans]
MYAITGVRRCGKTFFMFQTMRKLIEAGSPRIDSLLFVR